MDTAQNQKGCSLETRAGDPHGIYLCTFLFKFAVLSVLPILGNNEIK